MCRTAARLSSSGEFGTSTLYRRLKLTWIVPCRFSNISTISGFIAWTVIMVTYIRFHKALQYNTMLDARPYTTPLQPYATWIVLFVVSLLTLTNGFQGRYIHSYDARDD